MPIQVIEPRRLYLQIADQIRSLIAAEEFPAGSRLPAERELAKRFGVSRPTLREALIALEVQGHVDVRPGSGIVVTTANGAAAGIMKPKEIGALEEILDSMKIKAGDEAARVDSDRQFHRFIAAKLANKV